MTTTTACRPVAWWLVDPATGQESPRFTLGPGQAYFHESACMANGPVGAALLTFDTAGPKLLLYEADGMILACSYVYLREPRPTSGPIATCAGWPEASEAPVQAGSYVALPISWAPVRPPEVDRRMPGGNT
jgi:hypothetical protein